MVYSWNQEYASTEGEKQSSSQGDQGAHCNVQQRARTGELNTCTLMLFYALGVLRKLAPTCGSSLASTKCVVVLYVDIVQSCEMLLTRCVDRFLCMQAITKCCGALGSHVSINLIQGPPGTGVYPLLAPARCVSTAALSCNPCSQDAGKTHVICGILACLLHGNKFKRGEKEEEPTTRNGQGLRQNWVSKKRILVCAQSNSAIDELLGSLLTSFRF